jgi:hypothetical protein
MLALLLEDVEPNHIFLTLLLHHLSANMRDQLAARTSSCLWPWQRRSTAFFYAQPQGFVAVSAVSSGESLSPSAPRRRSPSHWGRHQQTRSLSRGSQDGDGGRDELCSYHINFGCKAERCRQPCNCLGNGAATGSVN